MYIQTIYNPNILIREYIIDKYDRKDFFNNDDEAVKIIDDFEYLRMSNHDSYKQLIGVIYQDYLAMCYTLGQKFRVFETYEDLEDFIVDKSPDFVLDLVVGSLKFSSLDILDKSRVLKHADYKFRNNILNINSLYFFDYFELCRDYVKEDLICTFYEEFGKDNGESKEDKEIYAVDEVANFLYAIKETNNENYRDLLRTILVESYTYYKSESSKRKIKKHEYGYIGMLERQKLSYAVDNIDKSDILLDDAIYGFIEFNKKDPNERNKIKKMVRGDLIGGC